MAGWPINPETYGPQTFAPPSSPRSSPTASGSIKDYREHTEEDTSFRRDVLSFDTYALLRGCATVGAPCTAESDGDVMEPAWSGAADREEKLSDYERGDEDDLESDETQDQTTSQPGQKITLEFLSRHGFYDMPMAKAARILGRTEGSFQRICRGLGILRWPYRVRKSLQAIMLKTEQYLDDSSQEDGMSKAEVLKVLQAHMDDIKGISGTGMDKATKQYRQYIFKLNHKLARKADKQGSNAAATASGSAFKAKGMLRAASRIRKVRQQESVRHDGSQKGRRPTASEKGPAAPTRPKPRHFKDLPPSLALSPPGHGVDIMGTMASSAALHSRLRSAGSGDLDAAKLQHELLRLSSKMDSRLLAAEREIALFGPPATRTSPTPNLTLDHACQLLAAGIGLDRLRPLEVPSFGARSSACSAWVAQ